MTNVFPRHTKVQTPVAIRGDGCYIIDSNGKRYLDGSGGAAVSCLGHSDSGVVEAISSQLGSVAFAHTSFFTSEPAEALASRLTGLAPDGLERVYFVSGGSEAVEASLKLARQYFLEKGEPQRKHLIARRQSYHGNTLGALAAGGNEWRRTPFAPLLMSSHHIPACYPYRDRKDGESEFDYGQRVANSLEQQIQQLDPDSVMAFIAEPVVGATLGAVCAVDGYFKRVREICDQYGILLILDEVMCGMGRTGSLFACEQEGVTPDIVVIAKGLGAGYQPIGAMLCADHVYQAIEQGSGFFQHGHTYIGHPAACAGALAVVNSIIERDLLSSVKTQGDRLKNLLSIEFGQHPHVGDVRGRGLFIGLELVADRDTKSPFDPALAVHKQVKRFAMEEGLLCYPMGGTVDGRHGDHVLLAPPYIISDVEIDELVSKLSKAIHRSIP